METGKGNRDANLNYNHNNTLNILGVKIFNIRNETSL